MALPTAVYLPIYTSNQRHWEIRAFWKGGQMQLRDDKHRQVTLRQLCLLGRG